jgi:hypothetical protein
MNMLIHNTLKLTSILIGISLIISSLEFINLSPIFNKSGIWSPQLMKLEFKKYPPLVTTIFNFLFQEKIFNSLLYLRLIAALITLVWMNSFFILFLLVSTVIIAIRFRGSFNGGSDYTTILTLLSLTISCLIPSLATPMMGYLAFQIILSYFLAGLVKFKNSEWRSGKALKNLFLGPNYSPPIFLIRIFEKKSISFVFCWLTIVLELLFPMILGSNHIMVFLVFAGMFHLFNFVSFGLNRFFWSWLAAYPALYFTINYLDLSFF